MIIGPPYLAAEGCVHAAMDKLKTEMANQTGEAWHARPVLDVIPALETGQEGLSDEEALRRLERCGPNRLPSPSS